MNFGLSYSQIIHYLENNISNLFYQTAVSAFLFYGQVFERNKSISASALVSFFL